MALILNSGGSKEITTGSSISASGNSFSCVKGKHYLVTAWIANGNQIVCSNMQALGAQTGESVAQQAGLYRCGLFVATATGTSNVSDVLKSLVVIEYDA